MKYTEDTISKGRLHTVVVREQPTEAVLSKAKGTVRKRIAEDVFDINDSVADTSKMLSLAMSMISRMWETTPQAQKDLLAPEMVAMFDATVVAFLATDTWADVQFAQESMSLVEKLISRQGEIGSIIAEEYKIPTQK